MIDAMSSKELKKVVRRALATLTPREEVVLRMRFGIGYKQPYTLDKVGLEFDVTRERIRQIEIKALRKLRHPSRTKFLRQYVEDWAVLDAPVVVVDTSEDGTVDMEQIDTRESLAAAARAKAEEKAAKTKDMYKEGLRNLSLDANSLDYRMYWYTKDEKIAPIVRKTLRNNLISRINDFGKFEKRCIEIKAESEKQL
jgi:hypothetical protein